MSLYIFLYSGKTDMLAWEVGFTQYRSEMKNKELAWAEPLAWASCSKHRAKCQELLYTTSLEGRTPYDLASANSEVPSCILNSISILSQFFMNFKQKINQCLVTVGLSWCSALENRPVIIRWQASLGGSLAQHCVCIRHWLGCFGAMHPILGSNRIF